MSETMEKEEKMKVEEEATAPAEEEEGEKPVAASGGGGSGSRRKRSPQKVEKEKGEPVQRTPLKRQRNPVKLFQSPAEQDKAMIRTPKAGTSKEEIQNEILYKKNSFLALRGDDGSFFLCRLNQNVTSGGKTRKFKLNWLSLSESPNTYKLDYMDKADMDSILTNISMDRVARDVYQLPDSEKERIDKVLNKTLKFVAGDLMDEDLEEEEMAMNDVEEAEDDDSIDEPPAKRKRTTPAAESKKKTSSKGNKKTSPPKKDKVKDKKRKLKEEKGQKKGKGPDRNLRPNPKIKVLEKDPFFEAKDKGPFISIPVKSKQVFAALATGDMDMLKELVENDNVYKLSMERSPGVEETPIELALKKNTLDMMDILVADVYGKAAPRLAKGPPVTLMQATGTGRYDPIYLGIRAIRELNVSRGSREGNNAFAKDKMESDRDYEYYVERAFSMGASTATVDRLVESLANASTGHPSRDDVVEQCFAKIHLALESGHRELASKWVAEAVRVGGYGFNFLHDEVLRFEKEDLRDNILGASVRKKPFDGRAITPLHCSAINPNVKYLQRLLEVEPDINLMDRTNRRPIHYAATCSGTKPLEFLISKGAAVTDMDKQGNLPLHRACAAGRAHNVTVLLKHAASNVDKNDATISKWGVGWINRGNRNTYCPIHLAVMNGHMDVLKVLLKNEVNVNKQLSAGKNKMTPLMLAAERGCLEMVRLLVQSGASVELLDKLKRSALTHAVMNGNTNVASYLLYLGADPNRVDTSGNSLVHYAAAYGWFHCLKLLIKDAGAKYNVDNDWKTTPLAIAFLKGHPGIVDYLLSLPDTDINFKDEKGMTLVSIAASSRLQPGLENQISYLVKEKKADPTIADLDGLTALHHLCANNIRLEGSSWSRAPEASEKAMETSIKVANILLDAGCDISQPTNVGKTPVSLALNQVNFKLVELLVQQGAEIPTEKNEEEKNLLHSLAETCCTTNMKPLIYILAGQTDPAGAGDQKRLAQSGEEKMEVDAITDGAGDASNVQPSTAGAAPTTAAAAEPRQSLRDALKKMAMDTDFLGFTPLLRACQVYRTYQVPRNPRANRVENDQKWGRDFIQALIEVAGSDVNAAVKEKNIPDAKEPQYVSEGGYTACHMMVNCQTEMPVKEGDKEVKHPGLALILRYKPDLEKKELRGFTPLIMASKEKAVDKVALLAEKGANPNVVFKYGTKDDELITPCLWLAKSRSLDLVKLFLKFGADPKAVVSDTKETLMHFLVRDRTAEGEVIELMKSLVDKGLSVNDRDSNGNTALHWAVSCNRGNANDSTLMEEFLISQRADVFAKTNNGKMPIHLVFYDCGNDPIELLSLMTMAMNNKLVDEPCAHGDTPLHYAACAGATICCMHLLQRGAQINRKDSNGNTPLTLAVRSGKDSCAIMLLQQGASVGDEIVVYNPATEVQEPAQSKPEAPAPTKKEKPVLKWRPLQQQQLQKKEPDEKKRIAHTIFQGAISSELQGVAHLLLDKTGVGFSIIEAALNVNKFNVALRLLKRVGDQRSLQGVNSEKQTLLHVLALKTKAGQYEDLQLQVAEALVRRDVPVDPVDSQGCTAVQYCAILHQPVPLAKLLIENSKTFDAKAKDKMGRDLVSAVMWDYEWVSNVPNKAMSWLDMLAEKGLTLDTLFDRPLPDVLLFGARLDTSCPDYFTTRGPESISPLILAIRHYNFGLARYLLKKGASVNFKDSMGYTPLIHAVKMNDITMVRLLLDYDHIMDKEEKASLILEGGPKKPVLMKKYSRNIFLIKTDKRTEENEKESSADEDEGEKDPETDVEEGISEVAEDDFIDDEQDDVPIDDEEEGMEMNGVEEEEADIEEEEEDVDDSDHDTDVVEDDEEDDHGHHDDDETSVEPPPRLGSKQMSLSKVPVERESVTKMSVAVTSNIRLNDVDPQGMTAFHHAVFSLDYGSFDNGEIVKLLVAAGGVPNKPNMKGEMPKDIALMAGASRIYRALMSSNEPVEKMSLTEFTVTDGLLADGSKVDYATDADTVLSDIDKDVPGGEPAPPAPPKVDPNCEIRSTGEVYEDETKKVKYDITLTKVDVAAGPWGMYNFYKLQIVRQKAKDMYVLFTRWGRIGDRGQWQHTPFPTAEDAIKEFCKVFRQKTGNDFNHIERFVEHKKKYRLMPQMEVRRKNKEVKFDFQSPTPSKLNPAVLDLLQELTSVNMLQAAAKSKGLDEDSMPFGRIMRFSLDKAKDILLDLEKLIATVELQRKNLSITPPEEYQANCEKLATLTNDFYHLMPVGGYESVAIRPIRDKKVLKEHFRLVADLMDMEVACKILLGSQRQRAEVNPYDYIYRSMGCKIQPLSENEHETQYILTYINASGHGCKVNAVYKVSRPGEAEAMNGLGLDNKKLLWHGTSLANIVSILTRGLLVSPPDAPFTGNLFGEGVYFADCFTKSRNYCYNTVGSCKVMLLCQVALGKSLEDLSHDEEDHHDEDVDSLKILGRMAPDPDFDIVLPYGAVMPLGQLKSMTYEGKTPHMQYNEYVIHNPKQICIRYIVMFDG